MNVRASSLSIAALALGSLAGCSGGGSGSSPDVTFSFAGAALSLAEGAPAQDVVVVLHTALPATSEDTSVTVFDRGTGSASSGSDYGAFASQVLTFPAGAHDGDTQTATFTALDDLLVEGASETARLGLSTPVAAGIRSPSTLTLTLQDVNQATIQFSSSLSASGNENTGPRTITIELDLPPGVSLGVPVSVHVGDAGTGTATASSDYTSFTPQTVTFGAGSATGAVQSVQLQVLDDASIETNETVQLALSAPSAGAALGAASVHQLTIQDDDTPVAAALLVSEGTGGVENQLADNDLVDLGAQTVDAGPNAGTRVRLSNAGGSGLHLGAPVLSGTDPNDFDVTLEAAPLGALAGMLEDPVTPAAEVLSPLVRDPMRAGPGLALALDTARLAELALAPRATLQAFPVPGLGDVTLELARQPLPVAPDAVLRVDGVDVEGGLESVLGDLTLWSGTVRGLAGSRVFLALSSTGSRGFLELPYPTDRLVHLVPEGEDGSCRVLREDGLAALGLQAPPLACASSLTIPTAGAPSAPGAAPDAPPGTQPLQTADCLMAIETDYQLYQKFGSSGALTTYVTQLMAAVSAQYFEDVQTTLSIAYLGVHTGASDGWTSQDSGGTSLDLLNEFIAAWAPNHWPVSANLAHFISGANLGGGVAYVNALCNQSYGFGVSGNISGTINWGGWTGQPGSFTWDFVVVAHEIGHNFGSSHTHDYCPPLDQCYANCTGSTLCSQGTIMSYCHTCGGMDNIDLYFHPVTANIMRQAVNASCLGLSALAGGDYVQYLVRFNPLTSTGQRNATLSFTHDASNAPQPFRVRLRGTAN